jgi:hypothetical protein
MKQGTLAEILDVEKGIRDQLDAERAQASRWLEDERREIERAHEAALAQLRAESQRRRDAALRTARDEAAGVIERARSSAASQTLLSDDELRAVVRRRIGRILPEQPQ